ncbi:MAG: hypothetical protein V4714_13100 [Bacteroidota bacterium]
MRKVRCLVIGAFLSTPFLFIACNKNKDASPDTTQQQQASQDAMQAQSSFDDAFNMSGNVMQGKPGGRVENPTECAIVAANKTTSSISIDFGSTNCTGVDGKMRKGKIIIAYQGTYLATGSAITITFDNYAVDNNVLNGKFTVGNVIVNAQGNLQYTTKVENGSFTYANNGGTLKMNMERTYELVIDSKASDFSFLITATGNVTTIKGEYYDITTLKPLAIKASCVSTGVLYPSSGSLSFKPKNELAFVLDYGDGTCDKIVSLTVAAFTKQIDLP